MFRHALIISILAGISLLGFISDANGQTYQGTVTFTPDQLSFQARQGFDLVELKGAAFTVSVGAPCLPYKELNIALPAGSEVVDVVVRSVDKMDLPGRYDIAPNPEPIRISDTPPVQPFIKSATVYERDENYPGIFIEAQDQWNLAGQEFVTLAFYPVQYNPVTKDLSMAARIDFEVLYREAAKPKPRTCNYSEKVKSYWEGRLKEIAHNPEDVGSMPEFTPTATTALDPDDIEVVIITTSSFASSFQPLADWRTKMGMPAKIVDITWIYANYSGANNQDKLKNFIVDANATWGALYFLLGGDTAYIPYKTTPCEGDNVPNDSYFADFGTDWKSDVYIGRACVNNTGQVDTFVSKVLTYEKNPPANYGGTVLLLGFDLDAQTQGQMGNVQIESYLLQDKGIIPKREYDSEPGGHETDTKAFMNEGKNLVNHIDHCSTSYVGIGSTNHGTGFSGSEAQQFNCGTGFANFNTLGCWPGNYPSTCWGEYLCRDDQGGVTFTGNSRYGWYQPGGWTTYSFKYNYLWWEAIYKYNAYRAGEVLAVSKNNFYPFSGLFKYIWTELNLLGDPALHFWTKDPIPATVTYNSTLPRGGQYFTVSVDDAGTPISDALVCLMKGEEVYAYGTTDASGDATLFVHPETTGDLMVTVTAQNYLCHEGTTTVSGSFAGPIIDEISPRSGAVSGGTQATVSGMNFDVGQAMTVEVGGQACQNILVVNDSTMTCTVPAGAQGWKDVEVSNVYGQDDMIEGFLYFPLGPDPFNAMDMHTESLNPPVNMSLVVSGNAGDPFFVYYSFGGGPLNTKWGVAGLDAPIAFLFSLTLPPQSYVQIPVNIAVGYGPVDLYIHVLGLNGSGIPQWAEGGNNPNGTESIWLHLNK